MNSKNNRKDKYKDFSDSFPKTEKSSSELQIPPSSSLEHNQMEYHNLTQNKVHTQQWAEYNQAQTKEKLIFYKLLAELLNVVPKRTYTFGRPRKSLRDMIFCSMIKIYTNTSSRRLISDLELAKRAGYIQDVPHFNTVLNYFDDSGMRMILHYLINISALPLKHIEKRFAVDSTGFGTQRFDRWLDIKHRIKSPLGKYKKAHVLCGVKTNVITAVEITKGNIGDSTMFEPLLRQTAEHFDIKEVTADKAYSSRDNLELAKELGAMPYIPFKSNVTGKARGSPTWAKMFKLFTQNYLEFAEHYHKRSNVETCFAMIKRKFGDSCRCKSDRSQNNEILCKVLAHNIVVLIHEMFELKIEFDFSQIVKAFPAQKGV